MKVTALNAHTPSFGARLVKNAALDNLMNNMDNDDLKAFKSVLQKIDSHHKNDILVLNNTGSFNWNDKVFKNDKVELLNPDEIQEKKEQPVVEQPSFMDRAFSAIKGFFSREQYSIYNPKNKEHSYVEFGDNTPRYIISLLDKIERKHVGLYGTLFSHEPKAPKPAAPKVTDVKEVIKPPKDFTKDLDDIALLENVDKKLVSKALNQLNIKDIEYAENKNKETTNIYLKGAGYTYDMTLGKADDGSISGIISKEYKDGKNELYMARFEFIETNKSNKMKVSFMNVVQAGTNDNAPVQPKNIKELTGEIVSKEQMNSAVTAWQKTGSSYGEAVLGMGLLGAGYFRSESFSPAAMNRRTVNRININLLESNSDIRKNKTFSLDKTTGEVTQTGAEVGKYSSSHKKHADWDFVEGPHGNTFEVPKFVDISEKGIKGALIIDIMHHNAYQTDSTTFFPEHCRNNGSGVIRKKDYKLPEYVKSEEELSNALNMLMKFRNGTPIPTYTTFNNLTQYGRIKDYDEVDQLIEVVREMLKAEKAYNESNNTEKA